MRSIVDKDLHTTDWHLVILDLFEASNRDIFITKDKNKFIKNCFIVILFLLYIAFYGNVALWINIPVALILSYVTVESVPWIVLKFNKFISLEGVHGIGKFLGYASLIPLIVGIIELFF